MKRALPLRKKVLFSCVAVAGAVGGMEAALRLIGVQDIAPEPAMVARTIDRDIEFPFMTPDPLLFWRLRPGFRGDFPSGSVTINSLGVRGPEIPRPADLRRARILCFGDSITFGYAVGDRETYSYFLEQYLGPERVEVVNCGVTGYTSHQVARWLGQLHPQLPCRVVMFCVGWNDFSVRPTDDLHYARQVRIAMTGRAMAKYSRIYRLLRNSYVKSSFAADGPPSLTHRVPPDQYQRNIQAIVSECRSRGAAPIAVDLPCRKGGEASHRDRYSAALRAACAKLDVPVLDIGALAPGFSNEEYFIDSCHFSVAGHQHLAKRIADALVGLGLVEKP